MAGVVNFPRKAAAFHRIDIEFDVEDMRKEMVVGKGSLGGNNEA